MPDNEAPSNRQSRNEMKKDEQKKTELIIRTTIFSQGDIPET